MKLISQNLRYQKRMNLKFSTLIFLFVLLLKFDVIFAQLESVKIIKKVDYNDMIIINPEKDPLFGMTIGFNDVDGNYHQLPQKFVCEDNENLFKPCIYFDGLYYFIFVKSLDETNNGYVYKYNSNDGFSKETVFEDKDMGYFPFFGKLNNGEPTLYFFDKNGSDKSIKCERSKGNWKNSFTALTKETHISLFSFIKDVQWYKDNYKQFPFKIHTKNYPFVPIFCKKEDLSMAKIIPSILYEEIEGSKIEIPNMPPIKTQSVLGECTAYSLAALVQKSICDQNKGAIHDCSNPPSNYAISYWGFSKYTSINRNGEKDMFLFEKSSSFLRNDAASILRNALATNRYILDSTMPYQNMVENLNLEYASSKTRSNQFDLINFLKEIYTIYNGQTIPLKEEKKHNKRLEFYTKIDSKYFNLNNALKLDEFNNKLSFNAFTYNLFLGEIESNAISNLAKVASFPVLDDENITSKDIKNKIIDVLTNEQKPLFYIMAFDKNIDGTITRSDSSTIHSIVICGYKKVINPENGKVLEVFKVQNSYGTDWQLQNNNGWIDAEKLLENTPAFWSERIKKIIYYSDVLVWLKY